MKFVILVGIMLISFVAVVTCILMFHFRYDEAIWRGDLTILCKFISLLFYYYLVDILKCVCHLQAFSSIAVDLRYINLFSLVAG